MEPGLTWRGWLDAGAIHPANRRHKTIAAPHHVDDVAGTRLAVAEHLAQRRDMHPQIGVVDERRRPRAGEQVLLGHSLPGALDQREQDLHGATAEPRRLVALEEDPVRRDQPERTECQGRRSVRLARAAHVQRASLFLMRDLYAILAGSPVVRCPTFAKNNIGSCRLRLAWSRQTAPPLAVSRERVAAAFGPLVFAIHHGWRWPERRRRTRQIDRRSSRQAHIADTDGECDLALQAGRAELS